MLAITYKKVTKIKIAEWGTPKKYLKKILFVGNQPIRYQKQSHKVSLVNILFHKYKVKY
jgi:hypothetical protein